MKKTLLFCLAGLAAGQLAKAQTATVTGTAQDQKGGFLHYVFVEDSKYKTATFSDSLGNFSITVHPDSKLQCALAGYGDTTISLGPGTTHVQVTLKDAGDASSGGLHIAVADVRNNPLKDLVNVGDGGMIMPTHEKGTLRGNKYLLDFFAHGYFINPAGDIVYNPRSLYDYDKMGGGLLITNDLKNIRQVVWDQAPAFTLFSKTDARYDFEQCPAIDQTHYVQVLASGSKYKIYKLIKTKFVRADYVNNGPAAHGNDYDEYQDDADYYVFDMQTKQPAKFSLRKKSVREAFAKEADKANKAMSELSGRIDDAYLTKLGTAMNQ
ncbi:MAG: hypothetical protein JST32_12925 [Bacteroidetes bacterium]|nr:hypothetical protein [Bacteroidota bacterium]